MTLEESLGWVELAAQLDRNLLLPSDVNHRSELARRILVPRAFAMSRLWTHMIAGRPALFTTFPTGRPIRERAVVELVGSALPAHCPVRVQVSPLRSRRWTTVDWLLRRWQENTRLTSTTDLHFRGSRLVKDLRTEGLSKFNLLAPPRGSWLEMLTLVLSTTGSVTDSHSDDCDGINHCLVGHKLWLFWDRLEGQSVGLQDVSYDEVRDTAAFDLYRFLGLRSAGWCLMSPGRTLFLPGHFTHRVITLERYFGFGSFCISLPGWPRTLASWLINGTSYAGLDVVGSIGRRVRRRTLAISKSSALRAKYGWAATSIAIKRGERRLSPVVRKSTEYGSFRQLIER